MLLSIIINVLLIGLGILHFNWAFGGEFGFSESLPTKENGERVLNPKKKRQHHCWNRTNCIRFFLCVYIWTFKSQPARMVAELCWLDHSNPISFTSNWRF